VDVAALLAAPSAAAYEAGQYESDEKRRRLTMLAALLAGAAAARLVWWLWPAQAGRLTGAAELPASVNGAPAALWPIHTLTIEGSSGARQTLPVSATGALDWPALDQGASIAYWRARQPWPLRLCVPGEALAEATRVHIEGGGEVHERVYALRAARGDGVVDLLLEACPREGTPAHLRYGVLDQLVTPPALQVGDSAVLGGRAITLRAIQIVGPGMDPQLPPGQARITVEVIAPPLDWPPLSPTLLTASGQELLPSGTTAGSDGAALEYLIPLPSAPLEVMWSLSAPDGHSGQRWRARLEPPADREAVLRDALELRDVTASDSDGTLKLVLTLHNRGRQPLQLIPNDLKLTQDAARVTLPDLAQLRAPLAAGETRAVPLELALTSSQPLSISAGADRVQVSR
jgi:hypothetical protein